MLGLIILTVIFMVVQAYPPPLSAPTIGPDATSQKTQNKPLLRTGSLLTEEGNVGPRAQQGWLQTSPQGLDRRLRLYQLSPQQPPLAAAYPSLSKQGAEKASARLFRRGSPGYAYRKALTPVLRNHRCSVPQ